jgi:Flp pilus assembly protein TadD
MPPTPSLALRLTALTEDDLASRPAAEQFATGLSHYHAGNYAAAATEFDAAATAEPANPKYAYFAALAQAKSGYADLAEQSLVRAVQLEQASPIQNWGQVMERVQGPERLWLEAGRQRRVR